MLAHLDLEELQEGPLLRPAGHHCPAYGPQNPGQAWATYQPRGHMWSTRSSTVTRVHQINPLQQRIDSVKLGLSSKVAPKHLEGHMWPGDLRFPTPALEAPGFSPGGSLENCPCSSTEKLQAWPGNLEDWAENSGLEPQRRECPCKLRTLRLAEVNSPDSVVIRGRNY